MKWLNHQKYINQITLNYTALQSLALLIFEVFVLTQLVVNLSSKETLLKFFLYVRQTLKIQFILVISLCGFSPSNSKGFCYSYECFCSLCEGETSGCYSEILEDDILKEFELCHCNHLAMTWVSWSLDPVDY